MPPVRLGKMILKWCTHCDVPILDSKICPNCNSQTKTVKYTPPGDIRPAFNYNLELIKNIIDNQFGIGSGYSFLPKNGVVLLNHSPDIDRLDEIIFNGCVQGALKFDLERLQFRLLPRISGAYKILNELSKGYVQVDNGAVVPILTGSNVLAPGITKISPGINHGDEVLVLDRDDNLLGLGMAYMSTPEMEATDHGIAVKVRWHEKIEEYKILKDNRKLNIDVKKSVTQRPRSRLQNSKPVFNISNNNKQKNVPLYKTSGWQFVLNVNKPIIENYTKEAIDFIKWCIKKHNLPVAVSYSGGKDSLATLLLVLDAQINTKLIFIDTGLEFPETKNNVQLISEKFSLELLIGEPVQSFWSSLDYFGPPGKDYRWCCKTCKLGPTTKLIKSNFPNGVLAFIGQRRYESESRSRKGKIWRNPWVPGQIGASPIQNWSALHIWMYLFIKEADYNPLYESGLERIGCWLCPASDMADLQYFCASHPDHEVWTHKLNEYRLKFLFSDDWIKYGLWRWKKLPKGIIDFMQQNDLILHEQPIEDFNESSPDRNARNSRIDRNHQLGLTLKLADGFTDCRYGLSLEGVFNKKLDLARVVKLLNILGEPRLDELGGYCTLFDKIDIYPEGGIVVKSKTEKEIKKHLSKLRSVIFRAMECIGCGICIGRCENNALYINNKLESPKVDLLEDKCQHCGQCLGPCPVENFNIKSEYEM